jgi:dihydroorotate dehydrogenase subfamily 1
MADIRVEINGIAFPNPVLPAAGPNVRTGAMMLAAAEGGAGGIVSKTVSVRPAVDARPTIRRTTNGGLMNSETWSEIPVEQYLDDLRAAKEAGVPLIASVGYRPDEVAELGALIEREIAPDAFEFSTHYTGKETEPLISVAERLRGAVSAPIWMKVSPNFPDIPALAKGVAPYVDGFVAINSYGPVLDFNPEDPRQLLGSGDGTGWMSGPPIRPIALRVVHQLATMQEKPVIGVGGVERGRDAIQFFMAGASLVQVCTAAIRKGHGVYGRIAAEIDEWLDGHGHNSLADIVGRFQPSERAEATRGHVMTISGDACTGCRACVGSCVHGAISMAGEIAAVDADLCIGCGYCQDSCRYDAMKLEVGTA